jgi:hypothetical protein
MPRRQDGDKLVLHQRQHFKALVRHHNKAELDTLLQQPAVDHFVAFFFNAHLRAGVAFFERGQQRRQQVDGGGGAEGADAQRAGFQLFRVAQLLRHGGGQGRHFAGAQQQAFAGVGHRHARGIALRELDAELRLQRAQGVADGGLRGAQPHGSARKAAAFVQGDQYFELGKGHDE